MKIAQIAPLAESVPPKLLPIDWPEPFGLATIEAMSCGTPVLAWTHGAVPEIVEDGVTGCIVDSVEAA